MKEHLGVFYDKTSDFQQRQFEAHRDLIRETVPVAKVKSLLDLGAGTGARTLQAFSVFPALERITALEPDWEMIAVAQEKYADPRVTYVKAPAEEIPPGETFDMAVANWAVHWVADKESMFAGLNAVTRRGAFFAFSTCERLPLILVHIDQYVRNEFRIPSGDSPFHYLTADEWEALLEKHGWEIRALEKYAAPHEVESAETYLDHWFAASAAKFMYGRHIAELSEMARNDLVWSMEAEFPSMNFKGGLKFHEDALFMVASRK